MATKSLAVAATALAVWGGGLWVQRHGLPGNPVPSKVPTTTVVVEEKTVERPVDKTLIERLIADAFNRVPPPPPDDTRAQLLELQAEMIRLKTDIPSPAAMEARINEAVAARLAEQRKPQDQTVDHWQWYDSMGSWLYGHVDSGGTFRYTHMSKGK